MNDKAISVSIVMGSRSDFELMRQSGELLDKISINYEYFISSIHRTPERTLEYAKKLKQRNIKVVIAAAGMANHLSGILAAMTMLPVIAVPIAASLGGVDALLSSIQMPPGTPVATVSINGAVNAALLAARILAISDTAVSKRLDEYMKIRKSEYLEKCKIP